MDAATRQIMFSSGTDDWQTPPEFFRQQHARHAFTIDGAADGTNHLLPRWWGPGSPERIDALSTEPWPTGARIWINPPYGRVQKDFIARGGVGSRSGTGGSGGDAAAGQDRHEGVP